MKISCFNRYFCFIFTSLLLLGSSCGAGTKEVEVPKPVAGFSYSVDAGNKLKVNFTNQSENAALYTWDFGDNSGTSVDKNPTHVYTKAGTYNVMLTVKNSAGASNSLKKEVTVERNAGIRINKLSILGDSYSTFKDHVTPSNNAVWYPHWENKNDVVKVEQTWWHQLLQEQNGTLEINNSYSGSTVCNTGYDGANSTYSSFITRMTNLGNPNTIIIMGGTNDAWANSPIGNYKYSNWTEEDKKSFRPAFAYMLDYLQTKYPSATIINVVNDGLKAEITNSQAEICAHYKVTNIQLKNINKQEGHPSISGMTSIKNQISDVITK
ncbi:MAG: SGNH/GDSL hydrolase family protein [Niabella sp.]